MADLVGAQCALRVLDLKDPEVVVLLIQLLHTAHVNLVFELGDTQVLNFDRVGDCPLEADRYRRQIVGVLDELELCTAVESFTLKLNSERLAVHDLEEDAEMVFTNFLRVVKNMQVHLLARGK